MTLTSRCRSCEKKGKKRVEQGKGMSEGTKTAEETNKQTNLILKSGRHEQWQNLVEKRPGTKLARLVRYLPGAK